MKEVKYWGGGSVEEPDIHTCEKHGAVPSIFMYVTHGSKVTPYPYCAFCWGESLMKVISSNL